MIILSNRLGAAASLISRQRVQSNKADKLLTFRMRMDLISEDDARLAHTVQASVTKQTRQEVFNAVTDLTSQQKIIIAAIKKKKFVCAVSLFGWNM